MVEGNPNPRILRFFCATPPTPKYAPAPADEEEDVDSPSVRAPIGPGLALNAPTSKSDIDKRGVDASLACACACVESLSLLTLDLDDFDNDFLDFWALSPPPSGFCSSSSYPCLLSSSLSRRPSSSPCPSPFHPSSSPSHLPP